MSTSGTDRDGSTGPQYLPQSGRDSGTAAIGQTTTYSSRPLASGDPTGSIVDHESADPMTYKLPEAGGHTGSATAAKGTNETGVTSSASLAAASTAWASHKQGKQPSFHPFIKAVTQKISGVRIVARLSETSLD